MRFHVPDEGTTAFDDVIRGHVELRERQPRGLRHPAVQRHADVPPGQRRRRRRPGHHPRRAGRGPHQRHARRCCSSATPSAPPASSTFAHLPLIVNEKRQKLSKRRDDVSVGDYIDRGYLPEAMVNYLATLGWGAPDGIEIRPLPEIVELFRLEDVNSSGAFFDVKKLQHFNGEYIRELSIPQFVSRSTRWLYDDTPWPSERFDVATFEVMAPLVQERVKLLVRGPRLRRLPLPARRADRRRLVGEGLREGPRARRRRARPRRGPLRSSASGTAPRSRSPSSPTREEHGVAKGKVQAPVRVAVTGRTVGPPLFESLEVLGRDETLRRIAAGSRSALTPGRHPTSPMLRWFFRIVVGVGRARRALRRASPSPRCGGPRARTTRPRPRRSW